MLHEQLEASPTASNSLEHTETHMKHKSLFLSRETDAADNWFKYALWILVLSSILKINYSCKMRIVKLQCLFLCEHIHGNEIKEIGNVWKNSKYFEIELSGLDFFFFLIATSEQATQSLNAVKCQMMLSSKWMLIKLVA